MENRISFIIVISLVCISVLITFWFTDRFLGEEYSPVNALPPLPEVFRDPFKSPVLAKPKLVITPKTETTKTEITFPNVVTKTEVTTTGIVQKAEKPVVHPVKTPTLPKFKITGIIYDETPLVIIEFNGKSSILEKGNEIIRGLKIKRIYIDSIDVSWEGKDYNIKLGGN